jgi:hypothetical protein
MQAIERSPLLKLDKPQVIGYLKAAGTRDPDVLYTHKQRLLTAAKFPKHVGTYIMLMGALCTLMILLAPIGIPLLFIGWFMRRRGHSNVEAVEAGFTEFAGSASAA